MKKIYSTFISFSYLVFTSCSDFFGYKAAREIDARYFLRGRRRCFDGN